MLLWEAPAAPPRPTGPGPAGRPDDRPTVYSPPFLVLVAALAIFEGYHWLHLMPTGSDRATGALFLIGVVPVTIGLTRRLGGPAPRALSRTARIVSVAVLALGLAEATLGDVLVTRALGVASLTLAGVLLTLTVVVETAPRRRSAHL